MLRSFEYAKFNPITKHSFYPYNKKANKCDTTKIVQKIEETEDKFQYWMERFFGVTEHDHVRVTGYFRLKPKSKDNLKGAINIGPTAVIIASESLIFRQYKGGIINSRNCLGDSKPHHAVLAVGYGYSE